MCKHREDGLRDDLVPGAPGQYNEIIKKCWNRNPSKRPSAETLYNLVKDWSSQLEKRKDEWDFKLQTNLFTSMRRANYHESLSKSDDFTFISATKSCFMTRAQILDYVKQGTSV